MKSAVHHTTELNEPPCAICGKPFLMYWKDAEEVTGQSGTTTKAAGFDEQEPKGWWGKKPDEDSQMMLLFKPDNEPFHYVDGTCSPELKYVHTLQNLYYSLTGEELTIGAPILNEKL